MGMSRCWRHWRSNAEYAAIKRQYGEKTARATALGQAISYRFKRDAKGWRVFATTEMMDVAGVTDQRHGAIGVDINADHLAVAETDASRKLRECLAGAAGDLWEVSAIGPKLVIGDAVAGVVEYAIEAGKPIVIERLDFRQKKAVPGGRVPPVQPDAVQFQLRQDQGVLPFPWLQTGSGDHIR